MLILFSLLTVKAVRSFFTKNGISKNAYVRVGQFCA